MMPMIVGHVEKGDGRSIIVVNKTLEIIIDNIVM